MSWWAGRWLGCRESEAQPAPCMPSLASELSTLRNEDGAASSGHVPTPVLLHQYIYRNIVPTPVTLA